MPLQDVHRAEKVLRRMLVFFFVCLFQMYISDGSRTPLQVKAGRLKVGPRVDISVPLLKSPGDVAQCCTPTRALMVFERQRWVVTAPRGTARLRAAPWALLLLCMDKYNIRTTLSGLLARDKKN